MSFYSSVKEFQKAFGHPVGTTKGMLWPERELVRTSWKVEEISEGLRAQTLVDKVDALVDLTYFIFGDLVEMGISEEEFNRCFEAVHRANMSKLFEDGQPHYSECGKVIKPKGWKGPEDGIARILNQEQYK